jgi:type VI secretion system protein ImpB
MKVDNRLTDDNTKLAVDLKFNHIDDFEPAKVDKMSDTLRQNATLVD